ncbi:ABC transporter substrate-binding protein [Agreia bicolorata]|uniref:Sugar ABC transporter substrate-binding protein n=1 Tax=Agreia bicolorata TaxID=110935 RepID=A0ABR5CHD5_9MICO|nr:sugar ABC transporter substrate-binding protein [Agreia bicolorata]KJC65019.1 sugar ABC transporter substrate-binding protein [Agreia bicolorata]
MRFRTLGTLGVSVILGTALLSGCSSSGGDTGKVTLEFWSWAPNTQKVVDAWNKANPDITVKYTDAGGGDDSSSKLLTASRAGNAPDLALVEYTTLPAMIVADVPADITSYTSDIKDAFTEGTWAQTTFDGAVYGIPQDVGPMSITYRQDIFQKFGIAVPKTWDDFKTAAEAVRTADPQAVIASIPPAEFGTFAGIAAQAGSKWWDVKDGKWTVGIADEKSLEVADYFQGLADAGLISTDPLLTPEYDKALNDGTMLSWPSALWAPGVLQSVTPDTAGSWAMAPLPQWTAGDTAVSYQGGSAVIVTKNSKHAEAAADFAKWYNASEEGVKMVLGTQNLYPAATAGQDLAKEQAPPALMPQQTDFYTQAAEISSNTTPVTWGPNVNLAKSVLTDALSKAITDKTPWRDAFIATQKAVIDDMTKNGFTVTNK